MTVGQLFSQRMGKKSKGELIYDVLPSQLRGQILFAIQPMLGAYEVLDEYGIESERNPAWWMVFERLREEYGQEPLVPGLRRDMTSKEQVESVITSSPVPFHVLDVIEVALEVVVDCRERHLNLAEFYATRSAAETVSRLNKRFADHSVGYWVEGGHVLRVDSDLTFETVTAPTLALLRTPGFEGANDEYLQALHKYRQNDVREAMNMAAAAFESVLKIIAQQRKINLSGTERASRLIDLLLKDGLFPAELGSFLTGVRTSLESAVPPARNNFSAHGQGADILHRPAWLAEYVLNTAASAIRMLVGAQHEAVESKKK